MAFFIATPWGPTILEITYQNGRPSNLINLYSIVSDVFSLLEHAGVDVNFTMRGS